MITNNVTRLLDSRRVLYQAVEMPVEKLGAMESAEILNISPMFVFKTIVVVRDRKGKPLLAVIPGTRQVNLKSLAAFIGEKKVLVPTEKEAEKLTGLQAGGISALALLNRGFQVILDSSAEELEEFYVSGGMRGLLIHMKVNDYLTITGAFVAAISSIP